MPGLLVGQHSDLCRQRLCVGGQSRPVNLLVRPESSLSPGAPYSNQAVVSPPADTRSRPHLIAGLTREVHLTMRGLQQDLDPRSLRPALVPALHLIAGRLPAPEHSYKDRVHSPDEDALLFGGYREP